MFNPDHGHNLEDALIHARYTPDAMLLVLASDVYDPDDYIRSYEAFLDAISETHAVMRLFGSRERRDEL